MISRFIKRLWKMLGDLRLSFYLLVGASAIFVTGAAYATLKYKFFDGLNAMRMQAWMTMNFLSNISITWWIPVLIFILSILGINTFICSADRIISLVKSGSKVNYRKFFHSLTPCLIHFLFITVMAGHGITFLFGSWDRIPAMQGEKIKVNDMPELTVESIKDIYFPDNTLFKNRILQTEVRLAASEGKTKVLSFLDHVEYGDYHLHLELVRKDKGKLLEKPENKTEAPIDEKTCNKAPVYHIVKPIEKEKERELRIVAVKDPGLPFIIFSFSAILILMVWYYTENSRKTGNRND